MKQGWISALTLLSWNAHQAACLITANASPAVPRLVEHYFRHPITPVQFGGANKAASPYSSIVVAINSTGIIWTTLDELVADPARVQSSADWAGQQVVASINDNSLGLMNSILKINGTDILRSLDKSGLGYSVLDGLLLDETIRSTLTDITYRVIESNMDVIVFVLHHFLRPVNQRSRRGTLQIGSGSSAETFSGYNSEHLTKLETGDVSLLRKTTSSSIRSMPASGSMVSLHTTLATLSPHPSGPISFTLTNFILLMAGTVIESQLFSSLVFESFRALNDTGVLVYTIKRFILNELYVDLAGSFCTEFAKTDALSAIGGLDINLTPALSAIISQTDLAPEVIGAMLNGSTSSLGIFSDALGQIITDLESRGLFVDLNNAIFSSSSKDDKDDNQDTRPGKESEGKKRKGSVKLGLAATACDPWILKILVAAQVMLLGSLWFV